MDYTISGKLNIAYCYLLVTCPCGRLFYFISLNFFTALPRIRKRTGLSLQPNFFRNPSHGACCEPACCYNNTQAILSVSKYHIIRASGFICQNKLPLRCGPVPAHYADAFSFSSRLGEETAACALSKTSIDNKNAF